MALIPALIGLLAQAPAPLDRALDEPAQAAPGGEKYEGVAPGAAGKNPLPAAPKDATPHLIWSGFQMAEKGSRLFFQTTGAVTHEVKTGKGTLTVVLKNCRVHLKNNTRQLDTRYFATPVRQVRARQKRKDVELQIALKEPASPTPRTEEGPDGTQFLVLDFPLGTPSTEAPPRPARPPQEGETSPSALRSP